MDNALSISLRDSIHKANPYASAAGTLHSPVWPIGTKELDRPRTPRGRAQKNNFQRHHPKNTTHANVVTSPPTTSAAGQMKCAFRFGATTGDLRSEFAKVCADLELLRSFIARSSFPSRRRAKDVPGNYGPAVANVCLSKAGRRTVMKSFRDPIRFSSAGLQSRFRAAFLAS